MILNEQLIDDMFQQQSSKENIQTPHQDVSLNFTVSSRSSKQHQKQPNYTKKQTQKQDNIEILDLANIELSKFNNWMSETDNNKFDQQFNGLSTLLSDLENSNEESATEEDLSIIRNQLFKKQAQHFKKQECRLCLDLNNQIANLKESLSIAEANLLKQNKKVQELIHSKIMTELKEDLLSKVQINLLNNEISQLNGQIFSLKSQKANLERTYLFNKTKNSQIQLRMELQKSKGLSAAKNSTNSSELMNRNHETIVFIDPIQSDIEEWIKFFQNLKNRYMNMCKKEENQRMRQLGRSFTKQEKIQLHSEERLFVIFSSIKEVWKNLMKIRENTNSFFNNESSKLGLRQKLLSSDSELAIKREIQKANIKNSKLVKVNQYLIREKLNLQEINEQLREQLERQVSEKSSLQQEMLQCAQQLELLKQRCKQNQKAKQSLLLNLQKKQSELQFCIQELKKMKKINQNKKSDTINQTQLKNRQMERKYQQLTNQNKAKDLKLRSLELKLKKQSLQKKKVTHQQQENKRIQPKNNIQFQNLSHN